MNTVSSQNRPVLSREQRLQKQRGFTLIEILITVVILSVGLLGLAGLVLEGMQNNQGAYLRTQASILAYDMADRMRANKAEASDYAPFSTAGANGGGASTTLPNCAIAATGCTPAGQVEVDLVEWTRQIQGVGSGMALLPGGVGSITQDATSLSYTVTVTWDEVSREGEAVAGDNSYSVEFSL